MPQWNPIPQVQARPVSSFYKGKAMRQQLAAGEQDKELRGLQIDLAKQEIAGAPSKREAAKKKAILDAENIQSQIDARYANGERAKLVYSDTVMKPLFQAYGDETDEDKALEIFNTGVPEAISRLPEDEQEAFRKAAGPDRVFDHDEIMRAGFARRYVEEKESVTLSDRAKRAKEAGLTPGTKEYNSFVLNEGGDAGRQRDDEIRDAEAIFTQEGATDPHRAAVEFVDSGNQTLMSPTDNTVYVYNKFTGKLKIKEPEDTRGAPPTVPYEDTLHALAEDATGMGPWFQAALAKGTAPLDIKALRAERVVAAKAKFLAAENSLIEAFRLNPRYPNAEITRIQGNIDIKPKMWDSAFQMRTRMSGSREFLTNKLEMLDYYLLDPTATSKRKEADKLTRDSIRDYLRILGSPQEAAPALENLPPVPDGWDAEDWRYATEEARARWVK